MKDVCGGLVMIHENKLKIARRSRVASSHDSLLEFTWALHGAVYVPK